MDVDRVEVGQRKECTPGERVRVEEKKSACGVTDSAQVPVSRERKPNPTVQNSRTLTVVGKNPNLVSLMLKRGTASAETCLGVSLSQRGSGLRCRPQGRAKKEEPGTLSDGKSLSQTEEMKRKCYACRSSVATGPGTLHHVCPCTPGGGGEIKESREAAQENRWPRRQTTIRRKGGRQL